MKLKSLKSDEKAQIGQLIQISVIAAVLVVLFVVIPVIGYNTESAVTIPVNNTWDSSGYMGNPATATNGTELWQTNSPMISVGLLIGVISVIIGLLVRNLGNAGQ